MLRSMRRLLALLALLAFAAAFAAEEGAKPEINRPYVVDTDVARWNKSFSSERREVYVKRDDIVAAAGAKPGMTVADIGAGTGLFTMLFSDAVKPGGSVYAVDISPAFVEYIQETAKKRRVRNVASIRRVLKPGGRLVVVDYERVPGVTPPARVEHVRVDKRGAIREIEAAGFGLIEERKKMMRDNYFLVFTEK